MKKIKRMRILCTATGIVLIAIGATSIRLAISADSAEQEAEQSRVGDDAKSEEASAAEDSEKQTRLKAVETAERALANSYVSTVGRTSEYMPSADELAALWELAELDSSHARARELVVERWFQNCESLHRAHNHQGRGLRAAIGFDEALRKHTALRATDLAERLVTELLEAQNATAEMMSQGNALAKLAGRMDSKDAARVSNRLVDAMKNPQTRFYGLETQGTKPLSALAARMNSEDAAAVARKLAAAMQGTQPTESDRLRGMALGLSALAAKMERDAATSECLRGGEALVAGITTGSLYGQGGSTGAILSKLATAMEPEDVARLAERLAGVEQTSRIDDARRIFIENTLFALQIRTDTTIPAATSERIAKALENPARLEGLVNALLAARFECVSTIEQATLSRMVKAFDDPAHVDALADALSTPPTEIVIGDLADISASAMNDTEEKNPPVHTVISVLSALTARMASKDVASVADRLTEAMEHMRGGDSRRGMLMAATLSALSTRMEKEHVVGVAARLAQAMSDPQYVDFRREIWLGGTLLSLSARIEPDKMVRVTEQLMKAMAKSENNFRRPDRLAATLSALAPRISSGHVANVARQLATMLVDAKIAESESTKLGIRLSGLAPRLDPDDAASLAEQLATAMQAKPDTDYDRLVSMAESLAALAAEMERDAAAKVSLRGVTVLTTKLAAPQSSRYGADRFVAPVSALAIRMDSADVVRVAGPLVTALEKTRATDTDQMKTLGTAISALVARMEAQAAAELSRRSVEVLSKQMVKTLGPDPLPLVFSTLGSRMESKEADSLGNRLAQTMDATHDLSRFHVLALGLSWVAIKMEPTDAAAVSMRGARVLTDAIEKLEETQDPNRLYVLALALSGVATKMEPTDASAVSMRGARVLTNTMEKLLVDKPPSQTRTDRLVALGDALSAIVLTTQGEDSGTAAQRGALALIRALEKSNIHDHPERLAAGLSSLVPKMSPSDAASLAERLIEGLPESPDGAWRFVPCWIGLRDVVKRIPEARQTRLLILSNMLLEQIPGPPPEGIPAGTPPFPRREHFVELCRLLEPRELAEMLKWPLCVGEAEKIVLAELERQTQRTFDGDAWKFVKEAQTLGIKNLNASARRPSVEDALEELRRLQSGATDALVETANKQEMEQPWLRTSAEPEKPSTAVAMEKQTRQKAVETTQRALTNTFVRTIGRTNDFKPSADELAALWELAELGPSNAKVRELVIEHWFKTSESFDHARNHQGRGLRAVTGLDQSRRKCVALRASDLAERLVIELEDPRNASSRMWILGYNLSMLAARMDPKDATRVANRLVDAMKTPRTRSYELERSGAKPLSVLAARMNSEDVSAVARRLTTAMKDTRPTDSNRLKGMAAALSALVAKMEPDAAAGECLRGGHVLVTEIATVSYHPSHVGRQASTGAILSHLATAMKPEGVASLAERLATAAETNTTRRTYLEDSLFALQIHTDAKLTAVTSERIRKALESPARLEHLAPVLLGGAGEVESPSFSRMVKAFESLAAWMTPEDVSSVADRLTEATKGMYRRGMPLAAALKALSARMDRERAARAADRLAQVVSSPGGANEIWLADTLSSLADRLEPKEVAAAANRLTNAMVNAKNPRRVDRLADTLLALVDQMTPEHVADVARQLAAMLEDAKTTNAELQTNLGVRLSALGSRLAPEDAASLAEQLIAALQKTRSTDYLRLASMAKLVAVLAAEMDQDAGVSVSLRAAKALVTKMEDPHSSPYYEDTFVGPVSALAVRIDSADIASVAGSLTTALEKTEATNTGRMTALGGVISTLVAGMEAKAAAELSQRSVAVLIKEIENPRGGSNRLTAVLSDNQNGLRGTCRHIQSILVPKLCIAG